MWPATEITLYTDRDRLPGNRLHGTVGHGKHPPTKYNSWSDRWPPEVTLGGTIACST